MTTNEIIREKQAKLNAMAASGQLRFAPTVLTAARIGWACQECGRKFKTTAAAERASMNGCPKCGGTDVDIS